MEHTHPTGNHNHPATFDEVIARGFHPTPTPAPPERPHDPGTPVGVASPAGATPLAAPVVSARQNQSSWPDANKVAFRNAITSMVSSGKYQALVAFHMDMSHNMHGSMGTTGLYRFLAWHRRYLIEFEKTLRVADSALRPGAAPLTVPYWRWQDPFPAWLANFLPAKIPGTATTPPPRKNAAPPSKATAADIDLILHQFAIQQTGISGQNDYAKFTFGLEGFGRRPDGSSLPGHNQGHSWVGGIMNNTSTSPTDPIFWLHHAEVDRIWEIWRQANPTTAPPLQGANRIMDPWPESYDQLLVPATFGYKYDSLAP